VASRGALNERVAQASAIATRSQPPKPASFRDAGFAAPCGGAGMLLLLVRVWLCEDLWFGWRRRCVLVLTASLRHFVTKGLLPPVVVLGCGFSLPACGFVRTCDCAAGGCVGGGERGAGVPPPFPY